MSPRKPRPTAARMLGKHEGLTSCQVYEMSPCGLLLEECETFTQERQIEEDERQLQWKWEDDLCRQVRAGEISIETAVRAAAMYAGNKSTRQFARTDRRWRREKSELRTPAPELVAIKVDASEETDLISTALRSIPAVPT